MATEIGWASLGIVPTFDKFGRELDQGTSKAMLAAGTTGGAKFGDAAGRTAGQRFGSVFKTAAKASLIGVAGLGVAAFKFAGDAVAEAREGQKVSALTAAAIKSTGGAAKVTEKQVGDLATRLSEMAGVDDELVQSGANVLLTFTKIRNEAGEGNKIFDEATTAALNMSAALKTDLSSASIQVGKALNDPVKGVTALGRAGVQFTEEQKTLIETLVESGDTIGAQKIILGELETQFKGAARSQATESDKLAVAYGNLKEEAGEQLLPILDDLAVFVRKKGIPAVRDFAGWVRDDAAPAVKRLAEDLEPAVGFVKDLGGFLNDLPGNAKLSGLAAILAGGAALKLRGGGSGALGTAGSALGLAKPVNVFVTNPGFGAGGGPGATVGPDGKPKKGSRPRGGGAGGLLAATVLGPYILDELKWGIESPNSPLAGLVKGAKTGGGGFTASSDAAMDGFDTSGIAKNFQGIPVMAEEAVNKTQRIVAGAKFERLTTRFEIEDYSPMLDRIARINAELDWAARPREARINITKAYSAAGYETRGGLQQYGGGPVERQRRRGAGGYDG